MLLDLRSLEGGVATPKGGGMLAYRWAPNPRTNRHEYRAEDWLVVALAMGMPLEEAVALYALAEDLA